MSTVKSRCTAIVLAAGSGSRMKSDVAKQFMMLGGKPLIWYALNAVEQSEIIDDCILVTGEGDIPYVKKEIVEKYSFHKVTEIVAGGEERYASVANALRETTNTEGYIFIHDGARPFLTEEILKSSFETVKEFHACVAAVPSKDTVKIVDENIFAIQTPDRKSVWNVQTPQVFDSLLIREAYERLYERLPKLREQGIMVTDDASVVEMFTNVKVKMVESSYRNIKITTPEDLLVAEAFLASKA